MHFQNARESGTSGSLWNFPYTYIYIVYIILYRLAWGNIKEFGKITSMYMQKMLSNQRVLFDIFAHQLCQDIGWLFTRQFFLDPPIFSCQIVTGPVILSLHWGIASQMLSLCSEPWNRRLFTSPLGYKSTPFLKAIFKKLKGHLICHDITTVFQRGYILISLSGVCEDCQPTVRSTKIVYQGVHVANKDTPSKGMDLKYRHLSMNR